ncbi:RHO alpha subunit C-terminal catalytic domain-containing protein [Niveispirillum fermenti]|uniref:RHO alpha subunit C-terminal catalytic domain-containing protein n=1 Tax=Niveispirillum fermenti TaxID=1233113 RepID=UPI003A8B2188
MLSYDLAPPRRTLLPPGWFHDPAAHRAEDAALSTCLPWRFAGLAGDPDIAGDAAVTACGRFVFCRQTPDAPPLSDWLLPFAAQLERLSLVMDDSPVASDSLEFAANWKILAENTLDDFHGSTVHPQTIHPAVDADWRRHLETWRAGPHSRSSWKLSDSTAGWWDKLVARGRLRRFSDQNRYDHTFIFPDLYVSSFHGAMVIVHRIVPLSVGCSRLEWRIYLATDQPDDRRAGSFRRGLASMLSSSARQVIEEDRPLCEQVQQARGAATGPGMLGWREQRIGDFHAALAAILDPECVPA